MDENNLSKRWLITFIVVALAALAVFFWAVVKQDVTVMVATGLVAGIQAVNIIKWLQNHSKRK